MILNSCLEYAPLSIIPILFVTTNYLQNGWSIHREMYSYRFVLFFVDRISKRLLF